MIQSTTSSEDVVSLKIPEFSFITLTGPPTDTKAISKRVRRHVMQDYVRKSKSKDSVTAFTATPIPQLEKPANHKGKFKLDTWKRRNKAKVSPKASTVGIHIYNEHHDSGTSEQVVQLQSDSLEDTSTRIVVRRKSTPENVSSQLFKQTCSFGLQADPFDTLAITPSDRLIWYCKSS
jgi:hypothetical protein